MASIVNDPGGRTRIIFRGADGKRHPIRFGCIPSAVARANHEAIAHLEACIGSSALVADSVLRWANRLPDKIYGKLAAQGLLPQREGQTVKMVTLGAFLSEVFAALQVKPGTLLFYGHTRRCLLDHFGAERDITTIGAKDADDFHAWLASHKFKRRGLLSPATVSRRILLSRHIFAKAIRWGYLSGNPFAGIRAGRQVNAARKVYVARETVQKAIDATTDLQFRLMLALSRYGGLRCPSEHLALTWQDVDWERGRITVRSCKTEHHDGGECRVIPIFADLEPYLRDVFEAAEPGATYVITRWRSAAVNLRKKLLSVLRSIGEKPWPRLFHNQRASCETDLAREYPLVTVAEWLGHNPAVMVENYLTNPDLDADFRRASEKVARKAARKTGENEVKRGNASEQNPHKTLENVDFVGVGQSGQMGRVGFETTRKPQHPRAFSKNGAPDGALSPDIRYLLGIWGRLKAETRAKIVEIAKGEL